MANNDEPIDLLQIKIDKARANLPAEAKEAIDSVDWKTAILSLREKRGYSFEQLGDLDIETELLLAGLVSAEDYPRELEARLKIPRAEVDSLVNEMNELVFKKIREELVKNTERKKIFANTGKEKESKQEEAKILDSAGIKIVESVQSGIMGIKEMEKEKPSTGAVETNIPPMPQRPTAAEVKTLSNAGIKIIPTSPASPATSLPPVAPTIPSQKLSGSVKMPGVKTEYTLPNVSGESGRTVGAPVVEKSTLPKSDPYREMPQ